jgi:hypothetical protein
MFYKIFISFLLFIFSSYSLINNSVKINTYKTSIKNKKNISDLKIYTPKTYKNDNLPCIIFLTGLNANMPIFIYNKFLSDLANKGSIIVSVNNNKFIDPKDFNYVSNNIPYIIDWCHNKLNTFLLLNKNYNNYNNNLVLSAHSCSNQAVINSLYRDSNLPVNTIILIDPVDGDTKFNKNKVIDCKLNKLQINKPVLVISNGLSNIRGLNYEWWPICAPDTISYEHFYNGIETSKKKILLKAEEFGHIDILDDEIVKLASFVNICKTFTKNNHNSYKLYRDWLCNSIINFSNNNYNDIYSDIIRNNLIISYKSK